LIRAHSCLRQWTAYRFLAAMQHRAFALVVLGPVLVDGHSGNFEGHDYLFGWATNS